MKKIFLKALALVLACSAQAHDFEVDGFYYNITSLTEQTVALTGNEDNVEERYGELVYVGNTYSGDIVVPSSVEWNGRTFTVNEIVDDAFQGCTLTKLVVPPSILRMHLSNSKIQSLVIEDGEELLRASQYMDYDLYDNSSMTEGQIGEFYMGRNSPSRFQGASIKKVTFGDNVTFIAEQMFYDCELTGNVVLPINIREVRNYAFEGSPQLEAVEALGVEKLGMGAFYGCSALCELKAPNLKYIGSAAFLDCESLTHFEIPQGVSTVGAMAFSNCKKLESVVLPNSIINFGNVVYLNTHYNQIFNGCPALKSITVNAQKPFVLEETNFDALTYVNAELHVPSDALDVYKETPVWKNFFNISGGGLSGDNVCSIIIKGCTEESYEYGGHVEFGGKKITESEAALAAQIGETYELEFIPDEHREVGAVMINETDVTNQIKDGKLVVEIKENMTIVVEWEYVTENPVWLTIKQAEGGCVKMEVSEWDTYRFNIEPSEGWRVHTVTYNGEDMTENVEADGLLVLRGITENAVLSIAFETDDVSVKQIGGSKIRVYGTDNGIWVSGANKGESIHVYNEGGMLVKTLKADGGTTVIPVKKGHVYIVKSSGKVVKIAL